MWSEEQSDDNRNDTYIVESRASLGRLRRGEGGGRADESKESGSEFHGYCVLECDKYVGDL